MLDLKFIRENRSLVRDGADAKGITVHLDEIFVLDDKRRALIQEGDALKAKRNLVSAAIRLYFRAIYADLPALHHPQLITNLQYLIEELPDIFDAVLSEITDGAEVRLLHPGQPHKYQVLPDFFLYPP